MAIIFIHGFGGCAGLWQWQGEYFTKRGQVLAVDLPGHGSRPWNGEDLSGMADVVIAEASAAGIREADLVVSSFGGLVALKIWEKAPALVRRTVFASALPRFTATDGFPAGLDTARICKLAGQFEGDAGAVLDMFFRSLFTMKERESEQFVRIRELRRGLALPDKAALLAVLGMLENEDLRTTLARYDKPALFLLGDSDYIFPLAVAEPLRQLCPKARIEALKGVGHFLFLSIPEVFNRRVERFLA